MSVQSLKDTHDMVKKYLLEHGDLGQLSAYEEMATKTLFIAAAGELEKGVSKILKETPTVHQSPIFLSNFIQKQAIERKYHSMFNWKTKNINQFAGLFGSEKKTEILEMCKDHSCVADFMFIGAERNRLAHNGLASEPIDKTFDELWTIFENAKELLNILVRALHHVEPSTRP